MVLGGKAMRYYGYNRMTYDLDIFVAENDNHAGYENKTLGLLWWQTTIDLLLENNGWIHVVDPLQNPDLNMNYGHSWAHPKYKIKVDIVNYANYDKSHIIRSLDGIKYPTLDLLLKIKMNSIDQRDVDDYNGKLKDIKDVYTICERYNIGMNNELSNLKNKIELPNQENEEYNDYKPILKIPYVVGHILKNNIICKDIALNHKPPDNYTTWESWKIAFEDYYSFYNANN